MDQKECFSKDSFQPLTVLSHEGDEVKRPQRTYLSDVIRRFKQNKLALLGIVVIVILAILSIFGPKISGYDYFTNDLLNNNQAPSGDHWFGTDSLGRDIFSRTWYGARISLFIGIAAAFIDLVIGVIWGATAGFFGGKVDEYLMRIADILYGIPYLLVVILLMIVLPQGLLTMIIAMSLTGWINMARIVRGQVLQLKLSEFVLAAQTLGSSNVKIMLRHLIPNTMGPILVTLTLTIPTAIFTEAFLSYLGLGVPAPLASWGTMSSEGLPALVYYPWILFFPAFFICLVMMAFNVVGDGLSDALDPKEKR